MKFSPQSVDIGSHSFGFNSGFVASVCFLNFLLNKENQDSTYVFVLRERVAVCHVCVLF